MFSLLKKERRYEILVSIFLTLSKDLAVDNLSYESLPVLIMTSYSHAEFCRKLSSLVL